MLYFVKTIFKQQVAGIFLLVVLIVFGGGQYRCQGATTGTITARLLNVRNAPSLNASRLTVLKKGTRVVVLDSVDGWFKISYQGLEGYIRNRAEYVRLTNAARELSELKEKAETINRKIESHRKDLKEYSRRGKELLQRLDEIDHSLHNVSTLVNRLQVKTEALEKEIKTINGEIKTLEQRIANNRFQASRRLVALYKLNLIGKMEVLATAESVYAFLKTKRDIAFICEHDEAVLTRYLKDRARLATLIENLHAEQEEKSALEEELRLQIRKMNREKEKRQGFLADIREKESLRKAALQSLQEAARELDQTIASLYLEPDRLKNHLSGEFSARKGLLRMPVKGTIITKFGKYTNRELNVENFRSGIDISASLGAPIRAVYRGQVLYASWFKGYGNMMIVDHGDKYYTVYAHAKELFKKKGDPVETREVIGTVGETVSMTGPTLYFEIRHKGSPVNPLPWLDTG